MRTMYKAILRKFVDILGQPHVIEKRAYGSELDDVKYMADRWASQLEKDGYKRSELYKHNYCGDWNETTYFFRDEDSMAIEIDNYTYVRDEKLFCEG